MKRNNDRPTLDIAAAINTLLRRNRATQDRDVAEMYFNEDIFVARLRRWKTIPGTCTDVPRPTGEADLFDLINDYQEDRQ